MGKGLGGLFGECSPTNTGQYLLIVPRTASRRSRPLELPVELVAGEDQHRRATVRAVVAVLGQVPLGHQTLTSSGVKRSPALTAALHDIMCNISSSMSPR